jgi:hypothetical protein
MRIEQVWTELEAEAAVPGASAWLTRLALPQPQSLLVALETATLRRSLLLPMPERLIPPAASWPQCHGLELISLALNGKPHFGVRLTDLGASDVFSILAEDLAPRISSLSDAQAKAGMLVGRLRRWQKFLAAGTSGLSVERVRGLYGELFTLRSTLLPRLGANASVTAWRAPTASHQDFQMVTGAVEVKTTAAKQPQSVRIASERQLDGTGVGALFLHVVIVDEREVENNGGPPGGESLPELVGDLRRLLTPISSALEIFEERLVDAGYLQAHAHRYDCTRFALRGIRTFAVTDGFPRIVEKELKPGVGEVSYSLSLAVCEPFSIEIGTMLAALEAINS